MKKFIFIAGLWLFIVTDLFAQERTYFLHIAPVTPDAERLVMALQSQHTYAEVLYAACLMYPADEYSMNLIRRQNCSESYVWQMLSNIQQIGGKIEPVTILAAVDRGMSYFQGFYNSTTGQPGFVFILRENYGGLR